MANTTSWKPRFVRLLLNAESPESYQVGGFCPVRLNQCFADRYRVLRKLGWGSCSTVWLARDDRLNRYVALKVGSATGCRLDKEAEALRKLGSHSNTPQLLDAFQHQSPNGTHQVLILEPLGRSLWRRIQVQSSRKANLLRLGYLKEFTRQILRGLSHVHGKGFVHRDIQPGNILFALQDKLESLSEEQLRQDEATSDDVLEVKRLDGEHLDEYTPSYMVNPWPLEDDGVFRAQIEDVDQLRVVLTDFGAAASFEDVNDGFHAYPLALRPPELVLGLPMIAPHADIWSLGCLIYEATTSCKLFIVDTLETTREERDDEHLQSITEVLGPLPRKYLDMWKRRANFVNEDGTLLQAVIEEGISEPLDELVMMAKPQDMDEQEVGQLVDFLRSMLRIEPTERMLTPELLEHPWLKTSVERIPTDSGVL